MSTILTPIITSAGRTAVLDAQNKELHLTIAEIALGNAPWTPDTTTVLQDEQCCISVATTALQSEQCRIPVSGERVNDTQIRLTAVEDGTQLEYWVHEVGFYLADGTLLAIWTSENQPLAYKSAAVDLPLAFDVLLSGLPADLVIVKAMNDTLLPPNSTPEERHIEASIARLEDIPISIGQLWNPDTCPTELLPWLAWAMSVDEWDNQWSEVTQRDFIKQSALSHCHKGTVGSVRRALDSLGVTVDFLEWFDDVHDVALAPIHNTTPHTFVLIAWANHNLYSSHEVFLNPQRYKSICRVVEQVKPVRSHFDFLVGAKLNISMQLAATTRLMQTGRLSSQTVPVQVPKMQQATSAILHLNRRRYAVARFYLI